MWRHPGVRQRSVTPPLRSLGPDVQLLRAYFAKTASRDRAIHHSGPT